MTNDIVIYEAPNKDIKLDVRLEKETIWLSLNQIATLFDIDKSGISRHIRNIYKTSELEKNSTVAKIATVQTEGSRTLKRNIEYYNLDMILSIGYRVNSEMATKFRIWATNTLKNFLVKGYALNEKRLNEVQNKFKELQTTISFMEEKSKKDLLTGQESELLHLISIYAKTLTLLEAYDNGAIIESKGLATNFILTYENCLNIVAEKQPK